MSDEPEGGEEGQKASNAEQAGTGAEATPGTGAPPGSVDANAGGGDSAPPSDGDDSEEVPEGQKTAQDLEAVFDVPVSISAVLGRTHMEVSELLRLESGDVIELDRKVGEAIDIYVNNRLIARGEVVLVDEKLGITMTEIIKTERH